MESGKGCATEELQRPFENMNIKHLGNIKSNVHLSLTLLITERPESFILVLKMGHRWVLNKPR